MLGEGYSVWDRVKWKEGMKCGKVSVMKSVRIFLYNMKLCKGECWVNLGNILYVRDMLVGKFGGFWVGKVILGGIGKDRKKGSNWE